MSLSESTDYLSLAAASKLLGVHGATLRRWADAGAIPVYLTPGGHRRFARADIEALALRKPGTAEELTGEWAARALAHARVELADDRQPPVWLSPLPAEERGDWRRIGQQLMGVVLRYVNSDDDDDDLLGEARAIGAAYARNARRVGMPLTAALEAALFFRDSLLDAALDQPAGASPRPEASTRLMRRISRVVDAVQLAVAAGYEE